MVRARAHFARLAVAPRRRALCRARAPPPTAAGAATTPPGAGLPWAEARGDDLLLPHRHLRGARRRPPTYRRGSGRSRPRPESRSAQVIAWFFGYFAQDFTVTFGGWAVGLVIAMLLCVPDWPMFNRHPARARRGTALRARRATRGRAQVPWLASIPSSKSKSKSKKKKTKDAKGGDKAKAQAGGGADGKKKKSKGKGGKR